jgi:hypothetical protein
MDLRPSDEINFIIKISKALNNTEESKKISSNELIKATEYIYKLKNSNFISKKNQNKILKASLKNAPTYIPFPAYYKNTINNKKYFLNKIKSNLNNTKKW